MAENIEFIAAKDLPEAESDTVDVVCVESGMLKRKSGASLGGGGGYLIKVDTVINADEYLFATSEIFDQFADILLNNGCVWMDASAVLGQPMRLMVTVWAYNSEAGQVLLASTLGSASFQVMCSPGTWTPPTE